VELGAALVKVVHLFKDYFPPTTGGIEQHMALLCGGLARAADVTVLVPSRSMQRREEVVGGVHVIRTPELGRFFAAPICPRMPGELRYLDPDIVHHHFPNPMGDLAYLLGGRKAALVVTYHADVIRQKRLLPLYRPLMNRLFARAQRVIVSAPENVTASSFLKRWKDRVSVIPYGIDLKAFELKDGEADEAARRRAVFGKPVVLFVGVLRPYKGLDVLMEAVSRVPGIHLVLVGRGPERLRLASQSARLGLTNRVTFLGQVPDSERRILLHACDVFVLPSIDNREAFGIAQVEAMACGRPVIATDLPTGVRSVNPHGLTGLLVPPGDADALAAAIARLLSDERLRRTLGAAARQRAQLEFSAERMIRRTMQVYEEVLGGRT
jgi:glycosyltransferase involved in cell wall biosynthesis